MSISESQKFKKKIRNSKKWLTLRHEKNVEQKGIDILSGKKLVRGCCLHHMDLNIEHYDKLENHDNFVLLNKKSHDTIHFIYNIYIKDKGVLDRLKDILDRMIKLNQTKKCVN